MFETLIGKKVRVYWLNATSEPTNCVLRGYSPAVQWVCLQGINAEGEDVGKPSWTRLQDVEQFEVLEEKYDPSFSSAQENPIQEGVGLTVNTTPTFLRASLHFDLPKAQDDFYAATHGVNAFSVLWEMREKFEKDLKNPAIYKDAEQALQALSSFLQSTIVECGLIMS